MRGGRTQGVALCIFFPWGPWFDEDWRSAKECFYAKRMRNCLPNWYPPCPRWAQSHCVVRVMPTSFT